MHARWMGLALVAALAACGSEDTVAEKKADAAKDVAMVKRMSKAPFEPIIPQPIADVDMERYGLSHRGCRFTAKGDENPIFVAGPDEGFMIVPPDLDRYAARTTSAELPGGAHSTYTGLENWLDIIRLPDDETGGDAVNWPARIMLHDAQERVAFMADGMMDCTPPDTD
ncbi:hypothetical protein [Novosphingobium profundi]|uniref:hypothetical protein n=1 Tax=Novosphingobium profundi TaxID=1774954 RepID=UPI001CFEF83C|nr:hypothetical protein [Novosphingobium profundi]